MNDPTSDATLNLMADRACEGLRNVYKKWKMTNAFAWQASALGGYSYRDVIYTSKTGDVSQPKNKQAGNEYFLFLKS